jgi:hypothetical protein
MSIVQRITSLMKIWTSFVIWSWLWGCMPFATLVCAHVDQVYSILGCFNVWFY